MPKLKIEKLVEGGQGIGYSSNPVYTGRAFFVWEALPGEELEAEIVNKRKGIYESRAVNILKPSPHRTVSPEDHFLSCSPWQIMDFEYENEQKTAIAIESYQRIAKLTEEDIKILDIKILSDNQQFGYRNKMEFSFIEEGDRKISLAFFERGKKKRIAINGCELAMPAINTTAKIVLEWINKSGLTERNLKSLIIRSNQKGETIAGLFIKDKINFKEYPEINDTFLGFNLYYSTYKSPASVITEVLYQEGQDFLIEEIAGKKFKYGINSFFQVNISVFEKALEEIKNSIPNLSNVVDFYSGVGTIGLSLTKNAKSVILVESNEEAVSFAEENIKSNSIVEAHCHAPTSAEKALDLIKNDKILIFDPPRAGLNQKIVDRILEVKPSKIVYLSCNVATQARDIGLLKDVYNIEFIKLYNFFPRTPHIESLCILEKK